MDSLLFQILAVVFALFTWSRAILRFKEKSIRMTEFIFWSALWAAVILVAIVPKVGNWFSSLLGISRPVDLLLYVAILVLFYAVFRLYVRVQGVERTITKIVREEAKRRAK